MITGDRRSSRCIGIEGSGGPLGPPAERIKTWSRAVAHDDETFAALVAEHESWLWRLLADGYGALTRDDPVAHRYLLLLRFALANSLALALVGAAAGQGWIRTLLTADGSIYSVAIVAVFAVGLFWSAQRVTQLSRALNEVKAYEVDHRAPAPAYLRASSAARGRAGRCSPRRCGCGWRHGLRRFVTLPSARVETKMPFYHYVCRDCLEFARWLPMRESGSRPPAQVGPSALTLESGAAPFRLDKLRGVRA